MEEALCMQSTLYYSLAAARKRAWDENLRDSKGTRIHLPEEGCIVSPDVEVLRGSPSCGYRRLDEVGCLAAVFSVSMPNKNGEVADTPVDGRGQLSYRALLHHKFEALLFAAIELDIEVLVVPDVGCGVFKNDPEYVGRILGNVIDNYNGYLKTVILTGDDRFANAAMQACALPGRAGDSTEGEVRSRLGW